MPILVKVLRYSIAGVILVVIMSQLTTLAWGQSTSPDTLQRGRERAVERAQRTWGAVASIIAQRDRLRTMDFPRSEMLRRRAEFSQEVLGYKPGQPVNPALAAAINERLSIRGRSQALERMRQNRNASMARLNAARERVESKRLEIIERLFRGLITGEMLWQIAEQERERLRQQQQEEGPSAGEGSSFGQQPEEPTVPPPVEVGGSEPSEPGGEPETGGETEVGGGEPIEPGPEPIEPIEPGEPAPANCDHFVGFWQAPSMVYFDDPLDLRMGWGSAYVISKNSTTGKFSVELYDSNEYYHFDLSPGPTAHRGDSNLTCVDGTLSATWTAVGVDISFPTYTYIVDDQGIYMPFTLAMRSRVNSLLVPLRMSLLVPLILCPNLAWVKVKAKVRSLIPV